nr:hypothetical transcript [Hymenolepis microstoma]
MGDQSRTYPMESCHSNTNTKMNKDPSNFVNYRPISLTSMLAAYRMRLPGETSSQNRSLRQTNIPLCDLQEEMGKTHLIRSPALQTVTETQRYWEARSQLMG